MSIQPSLRLGDYRYTILRGQLTVDWGSLRLGLFIGAARLGMQIIHRFPKLICG